MMVEAAVMGGLFGELEIWIRREGGWRGWEMLLGKKSRILSLPMGG